MSSRNHQPDREKAGGRVVLVVLLVLLLLAGGGYAAAYVGAAGKLPVGTTVGGVDVGGRTQSQASRALARGLADRLREPMAVRVPGAPRPYSLTPGQLGLSVDTAASVARSGGHASWRPSRLWDHYTGGHDLEPVVRVDSERLDGALDAIAGGVERDPKDATLRFGRDRVLTTPAREGRTLDREQARRAITEAFVHPSSEPGAGPELAVRETQPAIDDTDVRRAVDDFANPALSAPVTLAFGTAAVRLEPRDYLPALSFRARDGRLVPQLDDRLLDRLLERSVSDDGKARDARVVLVGGRPKVVPSRPGVTYDRGEVRRSFLRLVAQDGDREQRVRSRVARPDFTTADARALGIRRRVSTFTTYFPYAEYRNTNIGRAAALVDGTVLKPGETFSLNDAVGERTRANGFTDGFIISDGIFKEELGGGVSQLATTTFNAMFFAGLEDVEHKPHSFYIDRYPVGREATVAWGSVDLRFRDDTRYGVLIDTHVTPSTPSRQGSVTVSMWSTKVWDVTTTTSDRYAATQPKTRVLRTKDCYPHDGYAGFDVDVTRNFHRAGSKALDHSQTFHTTYTPSDSVVCRSPRS